jgi:hypothetical protein
VSPCPYLDSRNKDLLISETKKRQEAGVLIETLICPFLDWGGSHNFCFRRNILKFQALASVFKLDLAFLFQVTTSKQ